MTVPSALFGCWRRDWIRFADGSFDDRSEVIWLQTTSAMADLRLDEAAVALAGGRLGALADCSDEQLLTLARSQSSSGITRCSDIQRDGTATATWHGSPDGVDFQPVSAFPEPGILSWSDNGVVMTERAPSGAYVEQWTLISDTRAPLLHIVTDDGSVGRPRSSMYVAGEVAMLVLDRAAPLADGAVGSVAQSATNPSDRQATEAFVDCEFSFARRLGDRFVIALSTLPWRVGEQLDVVPRDRASP